MIRFLSLLFCCLLLILGCAPSGNQSEKSAESPFANATTPPAATSAEPYTWSRLTGNTGYSKAYNYQLIENNNKLYAFLPDGVWVSGDGKSWDKTGLVDILRNQAFLDYIEFNGAVYALGTFSGSISDHILSSQIARTTDMKTWEILAKESNLPKRFFYHPFVFQNKIWIIGGNDGLTVYNDAWNSSDGVHWEKVADELAFSARHSQQFVVNNDKIYMFSNDVWASKDGLTWEQVSPTLVRPNFSAFTPVAYDNKIWLLGNNGNGKTGSEVWYSDTGANWKKLEAPWSPRLAVATCVFNDEIVMTGGKYGGSDTIDPDSEYNNDVWVMHRRGTQ